MPDTNQSQVPPAEKRYAFDEQTGVWYELHPQNTADTRAAIISILYMLLIMLFLFWLLFDVWIQQFTLAKLLGYPDTQRLRLIDPSFRLPAYAMIGGALGGIVNGIRSFLNWYAEKQAFGGRFVWKYITAPWLGAALALFTFALIQSGVVIFGGGEVEETGSASRMMATFGIGVLSGYGAHSVFVWLDAQVTRIFKTEPTTLIVPLLTGETREEAQKILMAARLQLGEIEEADLADAAQAGKVIQQSPASGSVVATGSLVNITIGRSLVPVPPPENG